MPDTWWPVSGRGKQPPSWSASAIVADAPTGYHDLKIDGFSRTKCLPAGEGIKSCPFTVGRHRWRLLYYPNGDSRPDSAGHISIYLLLDEEAPKSAVTAQFQFSIGPAQPAPFFLGKKKPAAFKSAAIVHSFGGEYWGFYKFIKREHLEKLGHVKNDSFTIRCDIAVIEGMRAEETAGDRTPAPPTFVAVPPPDLNRHLGDLLKSGKGADVVFEVGGEAFAAHRCVLAARSPVFSAELFGAMKESNGVVRIDDMEAKVFRAWLSFVYTDSLPEMKEDGEGVMCQHLFVAADRYGMERLKLICEDKLCGCIDVGTVATILRLAEQHQCQGLRNACFGFLSSPSNLRAAMANDGFAHLSRSCPSVVMELTAMKS